MLIIEDHALVAQSLSSSLDRVGFDVRTILLPTVRSLEEMLRWEPAAALLDLDLGPAGSGIEFIDPLLRSNCRVIVVTAVTDPIDLCRCYEAGASVVLDKAKPIDALIAVLSSVLAGGDPAAPSRAELFAHRRRRLRERRARLEPFERLTRREKEVLTALMEGQTASAVASNADVSIWTVRAQIKTVLHKLGVNSQLAAVAMARRCGWEPTTQP